MQEQDLFGGYYGADIMSAEGKQPDAPDVEVHWEVRDDGVYVWDYERKEWRADLGAEDAMTGSLFEGATATTVRGTPSAGWQDKPLPPVYRKPRPFHFGYTTSRLLAASQPYTVEDAERIAAEGVKLVIDLREEHEWRARGRSGEAAVNALARLSVRRLPIPIKDTYAPTSWQLWQAYTALRGLYRTDVDAKALVHCRGGRERTAAVVVAYMARRFALSYRGALQIARHECPQLNPLKGQEEAVLRWLQEAIEP